MPATACAPFTDVVIAEPEAVYAARRKDHLSSHALADFRANPLLYRKKALGLIADEDRPAFQIGRAVHCRILEGLGAFQERFAVGGPINPKTNRPFGPDTKAFGDWAALQQRPVVSEDTALLCETLTQAVHGHDEALALLSEGVAEGVVRTPLSGTPCQGRIDWLHPTRGIVDLKTCDRLDWFEAEARNFHYVHQLAFYRALVAAVSGRRPDVHIIAVEKREPYRVGVWRISDFALDEATVENRAAISRLLACREADTWPTGFEAIRTIEFP